MNKKFLSVGLLTLGLVSMAGTTAGAMGVQATSIGHNSTIDGILVGEATETTENEGIYFEVGTDYGNSFAVGFNTSGVHGVGGNTNGTGGAVGYDGLYITGQSNNAYATPNPNFLPAVSLDYTDGDHLTPDNKLIVTIPVTNTTNKEDATARKFTRMNVDYVGSQYDIFNVVEKTHTTNIEPSTYGTSPVYSTVDYVFEITLKDGVNGYVDWEKFMTDNSEGHAPIVEDLEFNISGHENDDNGYVGNFSENFYIGDPETVDTDGAVQMDYTDSDMDLSITPANEGNVCYNGFASEDFNITNNGNTFVYMNRSAFTSDADALVGQVTENGGDLSFEYNGVDLVPYWTGDEDMQETGAWDTWQTFTINPGETVTLTISAEGESLEDYKDQVLTASATLPYSNNLESYT